MFNRSLGEPHSSAFRAKHRSEVFFCDRNMSVSWIKLRFNTISYMERNLQSRYNSFANKKGNRSLFARSSFSSWLNWLTGSCICNWSSGQSFYESVNPILTNQTGT